MSLIRSLVSNPEHHAWCVCNINGEDRDPNFAKGRVTVNLFLYFLQLWTHFCHLIPRHHESKRYPKHCHQNRVNEHESNPFQSVRQCPIPSDLNTVKVAWFHCTNIATFNIAIGQAIKKILVLLSSETSTFANFCRSL